MVWCRPPTARSHAIRRSIAKSKLTRSGTDPYSNDPSATQPVTYAYDGQGRRSTTTFNGMTTTLTLNDADLTAAEVFSGGTLGGRTVTLGFDNYLQRNSVSANTPTAISHTFGYDSASRLGIVTSGAYNSTYA